jgi:FtsP/CotA-like multicopper oxidase with cupredoxin domain
LDPTGFDRRQLLAGGGAVFFCTLAGHKLALDRPTNVAKLASGVPVPPRVAKAGASEKSGATATAAAKRAGTREYWIQAQKVKWNIVPTGRDQMMGTQVKGKTTFTAYAYRPYSANFGSPLGPATIPGPLIEAEVGDQVVVHYRNHVDVPTTIHPHGIFYAEEMDGAYKGQYTDPGGFVQKGRTFTYVWEAREDSVGTWLYHDHGPMDPVPVYKGMFGPLIVRDPSAPNPPDKEFFLVMHSFSPVATRLNDQFACINGRAYAGNTPTLRARVGQRVAFHVIALDDDFHTFHIHGHRWVDASGSGTDGNLGTGRVLDTKTLGPGESFTFEFVEDNPGRWFYHCHVFSHLHMGMNGWYIVS